MRREHQRWTVWKGALSAILLSGLWMGSGCGEGAGDYFDANGGAGFPCEITEQCQSGYVCFQNQCVFQGEAGPEMDAGAGPVEEVDLTDPGFSPPSIADGRVWITSPSQDTTIYVDATTLEIGLVEVGRRPTQVEARPEGRGAVVLNEGSDELSIITLEDEEISVSHLALDGRYNRLSISPSGEHVICWFEVEPELPEAPSTLQSVQVVALETGDVHQVAIGFKPSQVEFDRVNQQALVINEDGLSVFPLTPMDEDGNPLSGPQVARNLPTAPSSVAIGPREVYLTPDRRQALSLGAGESGISVLDIESGQLTWVELETVPTDLDLDPKGRWALVTLGELGQVARVPLDDLEAVQVADAGGSFNAASIGPEGLFAVLFEAGASTPEIGVMSVGVDDLSEEGVVVTRRLRKRVAGVAVAPKGDVAFIRHVAEPPSMTGEPPTADEALAQSHGWSLLKMSSLYSKLHTTPSLPLGPIFDEEGERVLVMLSDEAEGVRRLQVAGLEAFDLVDVPLGAAPEATGVIPEAGRAFVTLSDPVGRISFFDFETGRVSTVGGYVLNSRVR
ncbi:MAG: YncE family protein [Bradymonadia bacterium]